MFKMMVGTLVGVGLVAALAVGAGAANEARVRVIHASPDAPNVDVYANGAAVLTDVPFEASSGYLEVPAGNYKFEVFAAGSDTKTTQPVIALEASLAANTDYTVVALGEVANIEAGVLVDNNAAPAGGKAHLSVVHASPDALEVDIAVAGGPVLIEDLAFGKSAGPLPVDAGTYDLEVRVAGTDTVALELDGVALDAGKVYTVVATGFVQGAPALKVLAFAEEPRAMASTAMSPPNAGSGGLLDASSDNNNGTYLMAGAVIAGLVVFAGLVRRATVRN